MRGGRILWGQITVVFTIVLVMVWAATQWTAWRLGFQPQLGGPWFELAGWPVYYPPAFFWWWFSFDGTVTATGVSAKRVWRDFWITQRRSRAATPERR
jgi:type IV secretion system protein VirD4